MVLRQYYELVMKRKSERVEWGTCTQELKKAGANPKVVQVLDQIRDIHRNPLMHPEDFLTMKEAVGLFDIAKSAIGRLAEEIVALTPKPQAHPEPEPALASVMSLLGAAEGLGATVAAEKAAAE
jgi:hypothetical protein